MKRPKINYGWGSAPDPARGAYGAPLYPLVGWGEGHIASSTLFHSYYKTTLGYSVPVPFLTFVL